MPLLHFIHSLKKCHTQHKARLRVEYFALQTTQRFCEPLFITHEISHSTDPSKGLEQKSPQCHEYSQPTHDS